MRSGVSIYHSIGVGLVPVCVKSGKSSRWLASTLAALGIMAMLGMCAPSASAQMSATLSGTVSDSTGAVISSAAVTVKDADTGAARITSTDVAGHYEVFSLPVGVYEVRVSKQGFSEQVRTGIHLAVGQDAVANVALKLGALHQQVTVDADAPLVSVNTSDASGLVGEQQMKDLPLNGRSFDLLMMLNPGVVNFTSEKTGGTGVSNSTTANNFSVSGNRPQQNLFLLNGIEYTGAAENNMQPGGTSGMLLGVDAVREFNVLRDNYSAQYGKHPGAQVLIVTQSGSNQLHGSAYEYVRNNALDAPNYFVQGVTPPFDRNQFGASLGGPLQRDKTFLFGNYEGFRQSLNQTSAAFVPDDAARAAAVPSVQPLLALWPTPPAGAPDFTVPGQSYGIAEVFSGPLQTIREDFGTTRLDHYFSSNDSLSAVYTVDDGGDVTATPADPYSTDFEDLREQVFSLAETHIFSPLLLNVARFGYSRAGYHFTGMPTPGTPAASVPGFLIGDPVGAVVVGGSATSNPQAQVGLAGGNNGSNLHIARNLFTFDDRVTWSRGIHQFSFGVWLQPFQSNEMLALSQHSQATFASLQTFVQGNIGSFLFDPTPTEMNWRSLFGAWYAQDVIRLTPRFMLSLGFRDGFSTGWNEAHGRAANYVFLNDIIQTDPRIANSIFTAHNQKFLPQPRVGLAWSPFGNKTVVRAGFGMYDDMQDALGYRMDQNAPFNPTYSTPLTVSELPINPAGPYPGTPKILPAGIQPDMKSPTLLSYSLTLERELDRNTAVSIGYVGSHGYHEMLSLDDNETTPVICPAAPCPAVYPDDFPAPLAGSPISPGSYYIPPGTPVANPALGAAWAWFSVGDSSYNALQLDVTHRFSSGLSLRGVYTWSKALDDGDTLNATTAANAPGLVSNPFDLHSDWGPATYDVRNLGVINTTYELPIGRGKPFLGDLGGIGNSIASGWTVNSIITVQSGLPFTPELSYNPSNSGDSKNPVRPFRNPSFTGPVILGTPDEWFNPAAFLAPPSGSGFYGNVGRDSLAGPGLATWDFSVAKNIPLKERFRLQFRAELFNLLNRANFNTPSVVVFTPSGLSPTAGKITSTSTDPREVQFALKLLW
ncbi:MAG: carboxypeptidase regulatory-like domain-containing protein [Candidatus Acidiferrales bacterium]